MSKVPGRDKVGPYGRGNIGKILGDVYQKTRPRIKTRKVGPTIRKAVFVNAGTAHLPKVVEPVEDSQKLLPKKISIGEKLLEIRSKRSIEDLIKGEQSSLREGFVYLASNPNFPEWVKIGMTIDYEGRLNAYNTCDPHRAYEFKCIEWVDDRRLTETKLLFEFEQVGERKGEWFKITLTQAVELFNRSL